MIGQIHISNFRSIIDTSFTTRFSVNAFVGINESGKSNIFLALRKFINYEPFLPEDAYRGEDLGPMVVATFTKLEDEEKAFIHQAIGRDLDEIQIRRIASTYSLLDPDSTLNDKEKPSLLDLDIGSTPFKEIFPLAVFVKFFEDLIKGRNIEIEALYSPDRADLLSTRALLEIGGVTKELLQEPDLNKKSTFLRKSEVLISKKLSSVWNQEPVEITINSDSKFVDIQLIDGNNLQKNIGGLGISPEEKSDGFRWYMTFYTMFLSPQKNQTKRLLLIDDAGAPLHMKAQENLRSEFHEFANNSKTEIFYSTHSRWMISLESKDEIHWVEKKGELGTVVESDIPVKQFHNKGAPLADIGFEAYGDFYSHKVLLVEGITDKLILEFLPTLVSGIPEFPFASYNIEPAGGGQDMPEIGSDMKKKGHKLLLVFDSDVPGTRNQTRAKQKGLRAYNLQELCLIKDNKLIFTIEDFLVENVCIETFNFFGKKVNTNWVDVSIDSQAISNLGIFAHIKKECLNNNFANEDDWKEFLRLNKYKFIQKCLNDTDPSMYKYAKKLPIRRFYKRLNQKLLHDYDRN